MRWRNGIVVAAVCLAWISTTPAADLPDIPRKIAKEPVYKAKPRYCLVQFGATGRRMWVVLDGDRLYVDKNGNGDLTEPGKCLSYTKQPFDTSNPANPLKELRIFSVGDISAGATGYVRVEIGHSVFKHKFEVKTEFGKEIVRRLKDDPNLTRISVLARRNGKVRIQGICFATDAVKQAPVLMIDGPLTMQPLNGAPIVRNNTPAEFFTVVGTKGIGADAFAIVDYTGIPKTSEPLAEIEFPGSGEQKAVKITVPLTRC